MDRYIEVGLTKRSVVAVARLLEDEAPETVAAVWDSLPLEGPAFHAKYANNEVYTLLTPFVSPEPALEKRDDLPAARGPDLLPDSPGDAAAADAAGGMPALRAAD